MKISQAIALALSIAAHPHVVNAQTKDSIQKSNFAALITLVTQTGTDNRIGDNLAQALGLPNSMPVKVQDVHISRNAKDRDVRSFIVVYNPVGKSNDKHPVCVYLLRSKKSGLDKREQYFRINLDGKFEKAIQAQGKYDDTGKPIRGSGVKFDQDINSPDVKKIFNLEMSYWLKDWLKKERKAATQSSAIAAPR